MDKESMKKFEEGFLEDIEKWSKTEFVDEDEKNRELKLIQTKQKLIKDYYDTISQFNAQEQRIKIEQANVDNRFKLEKEKNDILKKEIGLKHRELNLREKENQIKQDELGIKRQQVQNETDRLEFDKKRAVIDGRFRVVDKALGAAGKGLVGGLLWFMFSSTTNAEYKDNVIVRPKVREILGNMWKLLI